MGNEGVWQGKTPPTPLLPPPQSSAAPEAGHLLLPQAAGISLPFIFFNNHFIVTIAPILSSRPGWVWHLPPHVEASVLGKGKPLETFGNFPRFGFVLLVGLTKGALRGGDAAFVLPPRQTRGAAGGRRHRLQELHQENPVGITRPRGVLLRPLQAQPHPRDMGWPRHCCLHPKIRPDTRAGRHGAAPAVLFGPLPAFWTPAGEGCTVPAHPAGPRCTDPITSPKIHPFISAWPRAYPSTHPSDVRQIAIALTHSAKSSGEGEPAPGANRKEAAGAFCRSASPKYSWKKAACAGQPRRARGRR